MYADYKVGDEVDIKNTGENRSIKFYGKMVG